MQNDEIFIDHFKVDIVSLIFLDGGRFTITFIEHVYDRFSQQSHLATTSRGFLIEN